MYERSERKTTTNADNSTEDYHLTERSTSGLTELFLIPIGITLTAIVCWLIIQVGVKAGHSVNPPIENTPYYGGNYHYTEGS